MKISSVRNSDNIKIMYQKTNSNCLNTLNSKVSFGLHIKADKEFFDFLKYLKNRNNLTDNSINNLVKSIKNLKIFNDNATSTGIVFGKMYDKVTEKTHIIEEGLIWDTYEGSYVATKKAVHYHFYDPSKPLSEPIKMEWCTFVEQVSDRDVLREIAGDYTKYKFNNELS